MASRGGRLGESVPRSGRLAWVSYHELMTIDPIDVL